MHCGLVLDSRMLQGLPLAEGKLKGGRRYTEFPGCKAYKIWRGTTDMW
jgi:hypothetical protein